MDALGRSHRMLKAMRGLVALFAFALVPCLFVSACSYDWSIGKDSTPSSSSTTGSGDASTPQTDGRAPDGSQPGTQATNVECRPGERCSCPSGGRCNLECTMAGCDMTCGAGASCTFECDGPGCSITCESGANCDVDCPDGNCQLQCASTSTCNVSCPGNGCITSCSNGAHCTMEDCNDNFCVCQGKGCQ